MESRHWRELKCANCSKHLEEHEAIVIADNDIKEVKYKLNILLCEKCANSNTLELLEIVINAYNKELKLLMDRQNTAIDMFMDLINKSLKENSEEPVEPIRVPKEKGYKNPDIADIMDTIAFLKNKLKYQKQLYEEEQEELEKNKLN